MKTYWIYVAGKEPREFTIIAGFRVERENGLYSIGDFDKALIKFQSESMLFKFLTV